MTLRDKLSSFLWCVRMTFVWRWRLGYWDFQPAAVTLRGLAAAALGWLCFRIVMALPLMEARGLYGWLVAWAGWYAYGAEVADA